MASLSTITLYAWAVPAFINGSPVDHTWVTSFDNRKSAYPNINAVLAAKQDYWFCWGSYHPKGGIPGIPDGFLGSRGGNLSLAKCLVTPNADSRHNTGARGTVFTYGVDGVCHQLANQVLYATGIGGPPLTVSRARGYHASTFLYGTYGLQRAAWAAKIRSCGGRQTRVATLPPGGGTTTPMQADPDDFEAQARSVLADDPELLSKLLSLRGEVQSFAAQTIPGFAPPSADLLNARNQHLIDQAAILLGKERFERVFGFSPDEPINLVDPSMTTEP